MKPQRNLLVAGVSGFVGGNVAKAARSWRVTGTYCTRPFVLPGVGVLAVDFMNPEFLNRMRKTRPDALILCAAMGNLDRCEERPGECVRVNAEVPGEIAGLCEELGIRLVHVSTDMVFGGEKGLYGESDAASPINIYGRAKLEGEDRVLSNCRNAVVARTALVYGAPVTGGTSFSCRILERLRSGGSVPLFVDQFRSPIWVQDLARALLDLAESSYTGILHLGGDRTSRYEFGRELAEQAGFDPDRVVPDRMDESSLQAKRPADVSLDSSAAALVLNRRIPGIRDGIAAMLRNLSGGAS